MSDTVLNAPPILERFRLDDRVAFVTGGGEGIGRGYAHALGEAGAAVAVVDIVAARAETVAHELAEKGIDSLALVADVTQPDQVQRMVERITKHWGKLTIAVNNAGGGDWVDAATADTGRWQRVIDISLNSVFYCAQAAARVMLPAGYGKIISTASMSGVIVNRPQNQAAYNAAKAAVIHLTRSLAAEWAPHGVRVNCISPGYTHTRRLDDMAQTPAGQQMVPEWLRLTPMGRMAEVSDLQGGVVYLAAPASDFMTGHNLIIDGGYSVW